MQFKQLKLELDRVFSRIQQQSSDGELPSLEDVKAFAHYCSRMQTQAPEEWAEEADDFSHLATQLLRSVKNEDIQSVLPLLDSLDDAMSFCHRTFRP
jgi:XXXCH domain-containing protein